jgi:hypothetical protein
VFAVENSDVGIYEVLLPLYFPRSLQEQEMALWQLPANVGGPDGEPLVPDRQIRIIDNPQHSLDGELLMYLSSFQCCVFDTVNVAIGICNQIINGIEYLCIPYIS